MFAHATDLVADALGPIAPASQGEHAPIPLAPAQAATSATPQTKSTSKARTTKATKARKSGKHRKKSRRSAKAAPARPSMGHKMGLHAEHDPLRLKSSVALVLDQDTGEVLFEKNSRAVLPIASVTKLMTALVVTEAQQSFDEVLEISAADGDSEKHTSSRLRRGTKLTRGDALLLALMASENRAAAALGRNYVGGTPAFVAAMNRKARELGMSDSRFADSTGLSSGNVSSANDLARLVTAAYANPVIRQYSTQSAHTVKVGRRPLQFRSSNLLIRSPKDWQIGLQKTGYTSEAGRCLVMQAVVDDRPVVMVFLDSFGKLTRFADANRVRRWLESESFEARESAPGLREASVTPVSLPPAVSLPATPALNP
jgi:D-alanyl-D-alanine endopeptidase (penicillin-binding protein 7)